MVEYIWGTNVGDAWNQSLSIDDNDLSNVSMYPNPTTGRINFSGLNSSTKVEIFSVEGKLLKTYKLVEDYIDVELTSGLYILKMND